MSIMTVPLMRSDVEADAPDEQKHVLAVLAAYNEGRGRPMPWSLLVLAMEQLQEKGDPLSLGSRYDGEVERSLYQVVQNLQLLNLVTSGPQGTSFTDPGADALKSWNGHFHPRKGEAKQALQRMGLLPAA